MTSNQPPSGDDSGMDATARHEYLQRHNVYDQLNSIVAALIDSRPEDPLLFLADELKQWSERVHRSDPANPQPRQAELEEQTAADDTAASCCEDAPSAPVTMHPPPDTVHVVGGPGGDEFAFQICVDEASSDDDEGPSVSPVKLFKPGDALVDFPEAFGLVQALLHRSLILESPRPGQMDVGGDMSFLSGMGSEGVADFASVNFIRGPKSPMLQPPPPGPTKHRSASQRSNSTLGAGAGSFLDLLANASVCALAPYPLDPHGSTYPPPQALHAAPELSVSRLCAMTVLDVVLGVRGEPEATPSILYAQDFQMGLQTAHLMLVAATYPTEEVDNVVTRTFYDMQARGMLCDNPMLRKLKFALAARLTATMEAPHGGGQQQEDAWSPSVTPTPIKSPTALDGPGDGFNPLIVLMGSALSTSGSAQWPPRNMTLNQFEAVIRAFISRVADRILDLNLETSGEEGYAVAKRLPHHKTKSSGNVSDTVTDEVVAAHLCTRAGELLDHVPLSQLTNLVRHIVRLPTGELSSSSSSADSEDWESSLSYIVSLFMDLGLADAKHVSAVAVVVHECCASVVSTSDARGRAASEDFVEDAAYFVASFTASVRGQIEKNWMHATEDGLIQFNLTCPQIAEVLEAVDLTILCRLFPIQCIAPQHVLQVAVRALADLSRGAVTVNRAFYCLASAGVFTPEVPRFLGALIAACAQRTPPPEVFTLWLCGLGQNLRGGLRVVFNVKQAVEDDGAIAIDAQQALQDVLLAKSVSGMMQVSGIGLAGGKAPPIDLSVHAQAGINAGAFIDALSPSTRSQLNTEDRTDLLGPHGWDFLRLGAAADDPGTWAAFIQDKAVRMVTAKFVRADVAAMGSCVLRMAAAVEASIAASASTDDDTSARPFTRLPLVLRALVCGGDVFMSMLDACMRADVASRSMGNLRREWEARFDVDVSAPACTPSLASTIAEWLPFSNATPSERTHVAQRIGHELTQIVYGSTSASIDQYLVSLACGGVWATNIHSFHDFVASSFCKANVGPLFRYFFHKLSCDARHRRNALVIFGTHALPRADASACALWGRTVACLDTTLMRQLRNLIDELKSNRRMPASALSTTNREVMLVGQIDALVGTSEVDHAIVRSIADCAIEHAQHGVTSKHQYAIASCILNAVYAVPTRTLLDAGVMHNVLEHPRTGAWVVAAMDRLIETLTEIALPPLSGMSAVLSHIQGLKTSFAMSTSRPSDEILTGLSQPGTAQNSALPRRPPVLASSLPRSSTSSSAAAAHEKYLWFQEISSSVLQHLTRESQALRGWYAQQTPDALMTLAEHLSFEDLLQVTAHEFQQCLQLACYKLMMDGITHHFFEALVDALDSRSKSVAQRKTYALLRRAGAASMTFPSSEDTSFALPRIRGMDAAHIPMYFLEHAESRGIFAVGFPFAAVAVLLHSESVTQADNYEMSYKGVKAAVASAVFKGLHRLSLGVASLQDVEFDTQVQQCLRLITYLTCGGQPKGFALIQCFGDLVASTCSFASAGTDPAGGSWARIMFKLSEFVEARVLMTLSHPPMVARSLSFDEFVEEPKWARAVGPADDSSFVGLPTLMYASSTPHPHSRVVARAALVLAVAWGEERDWTDALSAFDDVCEGLQQSELLWAMSLLLAARSPTITAEHLGADPERLLLGVAHEALLAYDNANRRTLLDLSHKRKQLQSALQFVDQLCESGACPLRLGHDVLRADILLEKHSRMIVAELVRTLGCIRGALGQQAHGRGASLHAGSLEPASRAESRDSGTDGALVDASNVNEALSSILPLSVYAASLAPCAVVESMCLAGVTPLDLVRFWRWLQSLLPVDAPAPLTSRKSFSKITMLPSNEADEGTAQAVGGPIAMLRDAHPVIHFMLRSLTSAVRDLFFAASAGPLDNNEQERLSQRIFSNQSLIHLNFQKNEMTAKVSLLADWQVPYITMCLAGAPAEHSAGSSSIKDPQTLGTQRLPATVLRSIILDVYHPSSIAFAKSSLNTVRLSANSPTDASGGASAPQHLLLLEMVRTFATRRASTLKELLCMPREHVRSLSAFWSENVRSSDSNRTAVVATLAAKVNLSASNAEQAVGLLDRIVDKFASVSSQPTAGSALLVYSATVTLEEEKFIAQVFHTQWGPFVHALLIALKGIGASDGLLAPFAQWFSSMRMLARVASALRKSGVQEVQFKALPALDSADLEAVRELWSSSSGVLGASPRGESSHSKSVHSLNSISSSSRTIQASGELLGAILSLFESQRARVGNDERTTPSFPSLRQWVSDCVLSSFTAKQFAAAALLFSDEIAVHQTEVDQTRNVYRIDMSCEAIRLVAAMALLVLRNEEMRQQQLQLPSCGPSDEKRTTRVVVELHPQRRTPPIDARTRERCSRAMVQSSVETQSRYYSAKNLRKFTKTITQLANVILDFVADVVEQHEGSLVDAYSKHEASLRQVLRRKHPQDVGAASQTSSGNLPFEVLLQQCVVLHSTLTSAPALPLFAGEGLQVALASFCRAAQAHCGDEDQPTVPTTPNTGRPADTVSRPLSTILENRGGSIQLGHAASSNFPAAEVKLFAYGWLGLMSEMMELYNLALLKLRRIIKERATGGGGLPTTNEALQASLLGSVHLLHSIASIANGGSAVGNEGKAANADTESTELSRQVVRRAVSCWVGSTTTKLAASHYTRTMFASITQALLEALNQCESSMGEDMRVIFESDVMRSAWHKVLWYAFDEALDVLQGAVAQGAANDTGGEQPKRSAAVVPGSGASENVPPAKPVPPSEPDPRPAAVRAVPAVVPASAHTTKTFSKSDVAGHTSRKDCWLIVHGKVYDVSALMLTHPGGMGVLISAAGKDASDTFESNHAPGSSARTRLHSFYVGDVVGL